MHESETEIAKACRLAGGQVALARLVTDHGQKVSPQAVHKWLKKGQAPADKARLISRALKGRVSVVRLSPDFPWPHQRDVA